MKINPLRKLETLGQSIWLDYIRSDLIASGQLKRLINEDGLRGLTSNPAIFEKAIAGSNMYDQAILDVALKNKNVKIIYETLSQRDVKNAADEFISVYKNTSGKDGYVSLEVNPHLAHDSEGTINEARRLWESLGRPNILIKVPATTEGLLASQQLISEGINVNVTLLFGISRYRQAAEAYIAGLEALVAKSKPIKHIASVASFFLSRIDSLVDPQIELHSTAEGKNSEISRMVLGQVAISSAKIAYQIYKDVFSNDRFKKLLVKGASAQRLLWASTSTKNPEYNDVKYIEQIIGPDTVNTATIKTIDAYREHGDPKLRLELDIERANWILTRLPELGINIDTVSQQLENDGVRKFEESFDKLTDSLIKKTMK